MDGLPVCGAPATTFWHLMPCRWGRPQHHCEPTGRANARPMTGSAKQSILSSRGGMDCFAALAMTVDRHDVSFSRHELPEVLHFVGPRKSEGAGKTGCALHPRSREHDAQRNALTSIQVQR